ncbi:hypothetical protein J1N35_021509, partial [Gossypium stocksii]
QIGLGRVDHTAWPRILHDPFGQACVSHMTSLGHHTAVSCAHVMRARPGLVKQTAVHCHTTYHTGDHTS